MFVEKFSGKWAGSEGNKTLAGKITLQLGGGSYNAPEQDEVTRIVALPSVAVLPVWQAQTGGTTPTR